MPKHCCIYHYISNHGFVSDFCIPDTQNKRFTVVIKCVCHSQNKTLQCVCGVCLCIFPHKFDSAKKQYQVSLILQSKGNRFSVNCEMYCKQGQHPRDRAVHLIHRDRSVCKPPLLIGFNVMLWSMPLSSVPLPMGWRHQGLTKVHRQTKPKWTYERVDWTVLSACSLNSEMSSDKLDH